MILLEGGEYSGNFCIDLRASRRIVVKGAGRGVTTIKGHFQVKGRGGRAQWQLEALTITSGNQGLIVSGRCEVEAEDCAFNRGRGHGVYVSGSAKVVLRGCAMEDNGEYGAWNDGTPGYVKLFNCQFARNKAGRTGQGTEGCLSRIHPAIKEQ